MPILLKKLLESTDKSVNDIKHLIPQLVKAAQAAYDEWNQDETEGDPDLGFGGICQNIAEAISDVLNSHGVDATTVDSGGMGEQHVWAVANVSEGVFGVDIDYHRYEVGGGYTWKKRLGVTFDDGDIDIYLMDVNWDDIISGY